jgi:hypothetical protein
MTHESYLIVDPKSGEESIKLRRSDTNFKRPKVKWSELLAENVTGLDETNVLTALVSSTPGLVRLKAFTGLD